MEVKTDYSQQMDTQKYFPQGSWINSAKNYRTNNGILYASLKRMNGTWNETYVQYQQGDCFSNNNGNFEKEYSKDVFEQVKQNFPKGSWINSARNYYIDKGYLYADLRRRDGTYNNNQVIAINGAQQFCNINGNFQIE